MTKVFINIYASLGMDCMGCAHDLEDCTAVEIEDSNAEALREIAAEGEIAGSLIEENLPELHDDLESEARIALHEMMVIQGWEEHGWDACTNDIEELMEEDDEEDEDAWEEAEEEKMGAMDRSELAAYLEERYGLATDTSELEFTWTLSL